MNKPAFYATCTLLAVSIGALVLDMPVTAYYAFLTGAICISLVKVTGGNQ